MRKSHQELQPWDGSELSELVAQGKCVGDDPARYDATEHSAATRRALIRCVSCPVRELCERVLLHDTDGMRSYFTGVAAGSIWLEGRRVTQRQRIRATTGLTTKPGPAVSDELTEWLRAEGSPEEIRRQHTRWNAGLRDTAAKEGERAYMRARARMKRAQARAC